MGESWQPLAAEFPAPAGRHRNLTLFVWLLAWGVLIHKSRNADWAGHPAQLMTSLLALALLFRPRDRLVLAGFAVAFLGQTWVDSPHIVNHWFLLAIVLVFVLLSLVAGSRGTPRQALDITEDRLFSVVRVLVIGLFAFAVLHKLNTGFLDTALSCAVEHYGFLVDTIPLLPASQAPATRTVIIVSALATEALIPGLLLARRTRPWGVALALAFHYVMGINRFHTFSAPALALYVAFLPRGFASTLDRMLLALRPAVATLVDWARRLVLVGMTTMVGVGIISNLSAPGDGNTALLGKAIFLLLTPLVAVVFGLTMRAEPHLDGSGTSAESARGVWAASALVVMMVVGMSPYLGLRTQFALSMFSNLRTEPGEWNHLLIPERMRLAPLQDDLVQPVQATTPGGSLDPELANAIDLDRRLVRWEFERATRRTCEAEASLRLSWYTATGELRSTSDACREAAFAEAPSALLAKVLVFKSVANPPACQH